MLNPLKGPTPVTRRGVITASLWTTPVVLFASEAPAFATSVTPPKFECEPKGNRSSRISKEHKAWDYHVKPGCTDTIECVWIAGIAADYEQTNRRWSVPDFEWGAERDQEVHIQTTDGRFWSGMVRFS